MKTEDVVGVGVCVGFGALGLCIVNELLKPGKTRWVFSPAEWRNALKDLIRPHEVGVQVHVPLAEHVGDWLRSRVKYIADKGPGDFWSSPARTLFRGGGDCDDLAILGCSALRAVGVAAVVRVGKLREAGHAWVEGRDQWGWFLLEATSGEVHRAHPPPGYEATI